MIFSTSPFNSNKQIGKYGGLGISASEDVQGERMSKVLISPETTRLLVMKPQMGWEVARAAAWQDSGAEGWSHLKAKWDQETKGWAFGAASNLYPLTLALALPPVCLEALTLPMQLLVPCWGMELLGSPQRPF